MITLSGRTYLVIGGSRGLGRVIVRGLVEAGAKNTLFTYYRNEGAAVDLAKLVPRTGYYQVNVCKAHSVLQLAEYFNGEKFDGLIHCAGINIPGPDPEPMAVQAVMDVNCYGAWNVAYYLSPLVKDEGSVVFIGSSSAYTGGPASGHYSMSKAALSGLNTHFAKRLAPRGVRVNLLHPGYIESEMADKAGPVVQEMTGRTLLGRIGKPKEVVGSVLFLLSDLSSYVTGQELRVDGGLVV